MDDDGAASSALNQLWDVSVDLPPGAEEHLRRDHPRLVELRASYADLDWPVVQRGRWRDELLDPWLDLRYFRGDTPYVWHYRDTQPQVSALKFFVFLRYVLDRDPRSLVAALGEDARFGCWTYRFPGYPACSRDLLDSVNELYFLDRHHSLFARPRIRVLDIGAGYGRLAHRFAQAVRPTEYCCVDAIPESTFLSEYYTAFREVCPPVRVLPLPAVRLLEPGTFDIAVNVHSFSEMPLSAIEWWLDVVSRLEIPTLFLVPNEADGFLSTETDKTRRDYGELLAAAGYVLIAEERKFVDEAVRELIGIHDRYCLLERRR